MVGSSIVAAVSHTTRVSLPLGRNVRIDGVNGCEDSQLSNLSSGPRSKRTSLRVVCAARRTDPTALSIFSSKIIIPSVSKSCRHDAIPDRPIHRTKYAERLSRSQVRLAATLILVGRTLHGGNVAGTRCAACAPCQLRHRKRRNCRLRKDDMMRRASASE